jgi:hypothetical protein
MSRTKIAITLLIVIGLMSLYVPGQSETPPSSPVASDATNANQQQQLYVATIPPPQTKLEAFAARKNVVIIKGYSKVAEVSGDDGVIRISAVDFSNADPNHPEHHTGLAVQVLESARSGRSAVSYVDAEDIDPLLDAIARLTQLQSTATKLGDFDAGYRTSGDLEITNLSRDGSRGAGVRSVQILVPSGQICTATTYFRLGRLQELSQQIAAAKQTLERMAESAAGK